jgi:putative transposase
VDARNTRWCWDGLEIGCDNRERVRVAFALRLLRPEAMSFVATTSCVRGEDVRDLRVAAVEHRFGRVNRLPVEIEWLTEKHPLVRRAEGRGAVLAYDRSSACYPFSCQNPA